MSLRFRSLWRLDIISHSQTTKFILYRRCMRMRMSKTSIHSVSVRYTISCYQKIKHSPHHIRYSILANILQFSHPKLGSCSLSLFLFKRKFYLNFFRFACSFFATFFVSILLMSLFLFACNGSFFSWSFQFFFSILTKTPPMNTQCKWRRIYEKRRLEHNKIIKTKTRENFTLEKKGKS